MSFCLCSFAFTVCPRVLSVHFVVVVVVVLVLFSMLVIIGGFGFWFGCFLLSFFLFLNYFRNYF